MFSNFKIDQGATFAGVAFLSCEPKVKFGSGGVQETDKEGTPKWEAQLVATFKGSFKVTSEVLKVGFTSHKNPADGLAPYTRVALPGFEVGVMEKTRKNPETGEEKVVGVQVWYRAAEIRPLTAAPAKWSTVARRPVRHVRRRFRCAVCRGLIEQGPMQCVIGPVKCSSCKVQLALFDVAESKN